MEFDPIIAAVVCIIACLIGYVIYLMKDPSIGSSFSLSESEVTALLESDIDMSLYDARLPEIANYDNLKSELGDDWKNNPQKSKQLQAALLKRAISVLEKAFKINEASEKLKGLNTSQMIPKSLNQKIAQGVAAVESEINAVKSESDFVRPGWSQVILNQAAELVDLEQRKNARKQQIQNEQQQQKSSIKQQQHEKLTEEQKMKKAEIEAEKNYQRLIAEEEAKDAKKNKYAKVNNKK